MQLFNDVHFTGTFWKTFWEGAEQSGPSELEEGIPALVLPPSAWTHVFTVGLDFLIYWETWS